MLTDEVPVQELVLGSNTAPAILHEHEVSTPATNSLLPAEIADSVPHSRPSGGAGIACHSPAISTLEPSAPVHPVGEARVLVPVDEFVDVELVMLVPVLVSEAVAVATSVSVGVVGPVGVALE